MCAIAGVFHGENSLWGSEEVSAMVAKMSHRGPDGTYIRSLNRITLGHARLSITDLTERANQPLLTEDGTFAIVFNGAIYNYRELRAELAKKGVRFFTDSDTEVFIQLFAEYGADCFRMIEGMFAAAIWDSSNHKLILARDRFGEKPLHYRKSNNQFYFASECDALTLIGEKPEINLAGLNHLLAIGYILNPATIYENIFSIPPASYLEVTDGGKNLKEVCYWSYSSFFEKKIIGNKNEIVEQFRVLFQNAVSKCVDCEVPFGFFLSGGLDSASILSLAAKINPAPLKAYTICFENKKYSEQIKAEYTARYFHCHHHLTFFKDEEIKNNANEIINLLSSPISDNSFLATYTLAKEAKQDCKVIITGDGADELMAGYSTYKADKLYSPFSYLPAVVKKFLSTHAILPERNEALSPGFIQKQFFSGILSDYRKAHFNWRLLHNQEQRIGIMGEKYRELIYDTDPYIKFEKIFAGAAHLNKYDQFLVVDALTWLTDNILVKADRALMCNGIESRSPFLNHKLAEFLASLPFEWKLNGFDEKYLLRLAMRNYLPKEILNTPKKGFNNPPFLNNVGKNQFTSYNEWFVKHYRKGMLDNHFNWN